MTEKAKAVLIEALGLPAEERAEIAGKLLESIEPDGDVDVEQAWRAEVQKRVAALDAGLIQTVSWEEARDRLFAKLREARAR